MAFVRRAHTFSQRSILPVWRPKSTSNIHIISASRFSPPFTRSLSSVGATLMDAERTDPSLLWEEETLRGYKPEHYYPVSIGQIFNDRYKTVGKLGFGSASTVWLCRDLQRPKEYVALKVYINRSKVHRELPIYKHLNSLDSQHQGRDRVRKLHESFEIEGPHGTHICLVHEALGMSLGDIAETRPEKRLSAEVIRETFRWVLRGIEYLHQEAHVIHTDLQAHNILIGVLDNSTFERFEQYEAEDPSQYKELNGRKVYFSRLMPLSSGLPAISDLSEARFGDTLNTDDIMPDVYRSPEVILDMSWSYPVDIWALGMVIWDLLEGKRLFRARNPDGHYSERYHIAQMIAIMGPPPLDLIQRSEKCLEFWEADGQAIPIRRKSFHVHSIDEVLGTWKGKAPIPDISLESLEQTENGEGKEKLITFLRKMLQWKPEDRGNGHDIFFDEWLLADLIEAGVISPPEE